MDNEPLTLLDYQEKSVAELKNVGARLQEAFAQIGIHNLAELLTFYPKRYLDRTKLSTVNSLKSDEEATIVCKVLKVSNPFRTKNRKLWIVKVLLADDQGVEFEATFFNQRWRAKQLKPEMDLAVFGKLSSVRGKLQMSHPIVDLVGNNQTGRLVPVYPISRAEKFYPPNISKAIRETLSRSEKRGIYDPLPAHVRNKLELLDRQQALTGIHEPRSFPDAEQAKKRLAFDELLCMQFVLLGRKKEQEKLKGVSHNPQSGSFELAEEFLKKLPYTLTNAQEKVIKEIHNDLSKSAPMHRLLQGDVGSGKTIVALAAILGAIESGHQAAFLVPTEVLAEQHYEVIRKLLSGLSVSHPDRMEQQQSIEVHLLTNRVTASQREELLSDLRLGRANLVVGTSALIYEGVDFKSLGLVVVDEQHRFGVNQRFTLRGKSGKSATPDSLAMTATPIPRTVAMTIYGDLDVSILDEMPPGRLPIKTQMVITPKEKTKMWEDVRGQVSEGKQVYVVCPLIGGEKNGDETLEEVLDEMPDAEILPSGEMGHQTELQGEPQSELQDTLPNLESGEDKSMQPKMSRNSLKLDPNNSVLEVHQSLLSGELKGLNLAILHGKMSFEQKSMVMEDFRDGKIDVLISTTVIEVGVDVPNATVMVILGAYRFGIAQLHQLRGRVGRNDIQSYCYLVGDSPTERLEAVASTDDGFELAERDLEIRREGTIFGNRQTGKSDLKAASLVRHRDLVPKARAEAEAMLKDGLLKEQHPEWNFEVEFLLGKQEQVEYLLKS